MLFWIVAGCLAAAVAALVARPLLAPPAERDGAAPDVALYRDQLAEVGREVERGLLPPDEAGRARAEIARRLLAADRAGVVRPERPAPRRAAVLGTGAAALVLVAGSLGLYAALGAPGRADAPRAARIAAAEAARAARPTQAEAEALVAGAAPAPEVPADYLHLVEAVRAAVAERPGDLRGWELLALHEARLGRDAEAARAQERVVALKGEAATAADHLALVDRLVAAAGGVVTAEAEAALADLARLDPVSVGGRFYAGLLQLQTGRPDQAFPLWRAVIGEAPEGDPYRTETLRRIEEVAWLAGADWTPPAAAPGPTADDVAAAEAMDPAARDEMVRGMVEGLRERLGATGGPPEDWARLTGSLAVLGDRAGAADALARGRAAHAGDAAAEAVLARAAAEAGLE